MSQPYKRTSPKKRVQELKAIEADLDRFTPPDGPDPRLKKPDSPPAERVVKPRRQPKTGAAAMGRKTYNTA
jgi:hypothetical protein